MSKVINKLVFNALLNISRLKKERNTITGIIVENILSKQEQFLIW